MIDEKKLIECLKLQYRPDVPIKRNRDAHFSDKGFNIGIATAEFIAEKLPKVGEWIPMPERPPQEDGEYLVWCDYGDGVVEYDVMKFDAGLESFGFWLDEYGRYSEFIYRNSVVAWMPLPEPYKENA